MDEPHWAGLARSDDPNLYGTLQKWLDAAMKGKYGEPDEDTVLAQLAPPLRIVWVLGWLEFEVLTGGFNAYFMNDQRSHADMAADALRTIDAPRFAAIVERATEIFDTNADAWADRGDEIDQSEMYAVIKPYEELPGVEDLSKLTLEWYEEERRQHWRRPLYDYLRRAVRELAERELDNPT